jgi:hypothetical protein
MTNAIRPPAGVAVASNTQLLCMPFVLAFGGTNFDAVAPWPWFRVWMMLSVVAGVVSAAGLWKMKKWALYVQAALFLGHCVIGPFAVPRAIWLDIENDGVLHAFLPALAMGLFWVVAPPLAVVSGVRHYSELS